MAHPERDEFIRLYQKYCGAGSTPTGSEDFIPMRWSQLLCQESAGARKVGSKYFIKHYAAKFRAVGRSHDRYHAASHSYFPKHGDSHFFTGRLQYRDVGSIFEEKTKKSVSKIVD